MCFLSDVSNNSRILSFPTTVISKMFVYETQKKKRNKKKQVTQMELYLQYRGYSVLVLATLEEF